MIVVAVVVLTLTHRHNTMQSVVAGHMISAVVVGPFSGMKM